MLGKQTTTSMKNLLNTICVFPHTVAITGIGTGKDYLREKLFRQQVLKKAVSECVTEVLR